MSSRCLFRACCIGLLCFAATAVRADEPHGLGPAVTEILSTGWEAPIRQLGPTQQLFDAAEKQFPGDARLTYALALVQFKHRMYAEGIETVRSLMKLDEKHLGAHRGEVWALLMRGKKSEALARAEVAAALLAPDSGLNMDQAQETARFLGGVVGFLRGPAANSVKEATLDAAVQRMTANMDVSLVELFEQGHDELLTKFQEFSENKQEAAVEAKLTQEEEKAQEAERLEREKSDVESERQQLDAQARQAEEDAQRRLSEIDKELLPLDAEFARLEGEASRVSARIRDLNAEANRFFRAAESTNDQFERDRLIRQGSRFAAEADRYRVQYQQLDARARQVNARRASLQRERQNVLARLDQEQAQIDKREGKLDKSERRISAQEKKNEKSATGISTKVKSIDKKATSVSTYFEFPLDHERQRLEESLEAQE